MKHLFHIIIASVFMTSCGLYSNYERDTTSVNNATEGLYRDTASTQTALATADTVNFGNLPWREVFTDPRLQALIEKALAQNVDARNADLTIRQAELGLKVSKLAYLPQIAFSPSGTISKVFMDGVKRSEIYELPLQASWQIDVFGSLRNAKKQSEVTLMQAKVAKQATQTALVAGVANMYYSLQMLDEQLSTTKSTLVLWKKNVDAMEYMKETGMANAAAVSAAKANYLQIQATVPTIEDNIRQVENSLCTLLHEAPHAIERSAFTASGFPSSFSVGVPLQLLASRPDVKIAELNLANAFYGVNKAKSNFYPQITISGQGAWTNSLGSMIVNPGKFIAAGVASLVQPLFAKGQLRANLKVAKLQQETAQLNFERSLYNAGQEVSNALSSYNKACKKTEICEQQVSELEKNVESTNFLFTNGNNTTYLETLSAQMNLLNGQLTLINERYSKVQAVISLYQALGGGHD